MKVKTKKSSKQNKSKPSCQETEGKKCGGFSEADTHVLPRSYLRGFPAGQHLVVALCSQWMYHHSSGENTSASRSWCILLIWKRDRKGQSSYCRRLTTRDLVARLCKTFFFFLSVHLLWKTSHTFTFSKRWLMCNSFVYIVVSWLMTKLFGPYSLFINPQQSNPFLIIMLFTRAHQNDHLVSVIFSV